MLSQLWSGMPVSKLNSRVRYPIWIVGAGPGDPDLLTVRAQRLIAEADTIIYADSLVPRQILSVARADGERIPTANRTLEEILPLIRERVEAGKRVVRLHDGDPALYGAIHEQVQAFRAWGLSYEIVPGISAYQATAARLGVELTVPGLVQSIILTRISGRTEVPETEELAQLAAHRASLCLYLSARHVAEAQAQLLTHYPAETPVAVAFRVGWPDEQIWLTTLAQMATLSSEHNLIRTTLYLISPALAAVEGRSRLYNPDHDHLFRPKVHS